MINENTTSNMVPAKAARDSQAGHLRLGIASDRSGNADRQLGCISEQHGVSSRITSYLFFFF